MRGVFWQWKKSIFLILKEAFSKTVLICDKIYSQIKMLVELSLQYNLTIAYYDLNLYKKSFLISCKMCVCLCVLADICLWVRVCHCLTQGHPADFMSLAKLELLVSRFIAWRPNHYIKLDIKFWHKVLRFLLSH